MGLVNDDMPLASPDWIDYMKKDRINIVLNLNRTSWITLKAGNYQFRFPAMIPSPLPVFNVWQVSLCRPNYGPCSKTTDPAVLVNVAVPGFGIDEPSPTQSTSSTALSGATRGALPSDFIGMCLLLLLPLLSCGLSSAGYARQ